MCGILSLQHLEEQLAGGKAQKGDVIYFEPVSWEEEDADCHIGFFWGDNSNDNRFWHSASIPSSGNQISQLVAKSRSTVYLFKTTHNGSLEIMKSSARSEITADNQLYSLEGAEYTVCKKWDIRGSLRNPDGQERIWEGRKSAGGFL